MDYVKDASSKKSIKLLLVLKWFRGEVALCSVFPSIWTKLPEGFLLCASVNFAAKRYPLNKPYEYATYTKNRFWHFAV